MKKTVILAGMLCAFYSVPANAEISINLGFNDPYYYSQPTYYVPEPAPAYVVQPSYPVYYKHRKYYNRGHYAPPRPVHHDNGRHNGRNDRDHH